MMKFNNNEICLYSAVFGDYETLNELEETVLNVNIRKVFFTDNRSLKSNTWEVRYVEPVFPMDSVRSQRHVKVLPHHYLPEFKGSIYIDNSVKLTQDPLGIFEKYNSASPISLPVHSYRDTVLEEFLEVASSGLDDPSRIFEQLNHYQLVNPDSLKCRPYWGAIIIRDHMDQAVIKLMKEWYRQILRYSRRDQLSLNYAELVSGVEINKIKIDNYISDFHKWPIASNRNHAKRLRSPSLSGALAIFEKMEALKLYERELDKKKEILVNLFEEMKEKYQPESPPEGFDPEMYLVLNEDVRNAGMESVNHYLNFGWLEGRRWK